MAIALAAILCLVTGFLVAALGLDLGLRSRSGLLLRISLSAGYGPACARKTAGTPQRVSTNKLCTRACADPRRVHYKGKLA